MSSDLCIFLKLTGHQMEDRRKRFKMVLGFYFAMLVIFKGDKVCKSLRLKIF